MRNGVKRERHIQPSTTGSMEVEPSPVRPPRALNAFARSGAPSVTTRGRQDTATHVPSEAGESSHSSSSSSNNAEANETTGATPSVNKREVGNDSEDHVIMMEVRPVDQQQTSDQSSRHNVSFVSHGFTAIGDKVKELNDTLAKLQSLGIQHVTNLPELVLVGDQSAGKSSLMSSFSGMYLPRSEGACTRCPVHIRLSASPAGEPWKCRVSLQQDYDYDGAHLHVTRDHPFGPWKEKSLNQRQTKEFSSVLDPSKIEETLRWAQFAILNPNHEHTLYRPGTGDIWRRHCSQTTAADGRNNDAGQIRDRELPVQCQAFFSPNTVALDITAPDLTDLSFYDLPGVFTSARQDEDQYLVSVVENLAAKYIAHKQAIILWAVPMNADPETSSTFSIIRRLRAQSRTIGVMTKADLLPSDSGASSQWMAMLRGEQHAVSHGYFITARPIVTQDLVLESLSQRAGSEAAGISSSGSNNNNDLERQGAFEEAFFNRQLNGFAKEWPECFRSFESRCGVGRLVSYMSQQLGKEFANCLPQITQKVTAQLQIVEEELSQLPDMPPNPEFSVRRGLSDFANIVRTSLEGADLSPQLSNIMQRFQSDITDLKPRYIVNVSNNIPTQAGANANARIGNGNGNGNGNAPSLPASGANSPFRNSAAIDLTIDDDNVSIQGGRAPSVNGNGNVSNHNGVPLRGIGASGGTGTRLRRHHNDFLEGRPDPSTPSKRSRASGVKAEPLPDYGFSPHSIHSTVYGTRGRNLFSNRFNATAAPPPSRTLVQVRDIISAKSQPGMPNIVAEEVYNFLSMEAVAPWPTYVGQLVSAVFSLLSWKLDELLTEALSGLRGRLIVTKSKQLLQQFLENKEQALRDTLLKQCKLESRKLYTLNEETLKRYHEDELRMLNRFRHYHRMKAYMVRNAAVANNHNNPNPPAERTRPKAWEDMVDEERKREEVQMTQEMAKLGPEPFMVELEVCAYVRAYYRTASLRFIDTCTLQVISGLVGEVVEELADQLYLDVALGLMGGATSIPEAAPARPTEQTFLDLMEEDAATASRRTALKEERERYQRTIDSIKELGDNHLGPSQASGSGASHGNGNSNGNGHANEHGGMIIDDDDELDGQV